MHKEAEVRRLTIQRDRARNTMVLGVMALFLLGAGYGVTGSLGWAHEGGLLGQLSQLLGAILVLALSLAVGSGLMWMYWGYRLRRLNDPWAYDPDLDGPDPNVRRGLEDAEEADK